MRSTFWCPRCAVYAIDGRWSTRSDDQVTFPVRVPGNGAILDLCGSLADHDFGTDELLAASTCSSPRLPRRRPRHGLA
jgi:hypothetical protein